MKVTVNGENRQAPEGTTVRALIEQLKLTGRAVAVEVNRQLVPRREHENATLREGDEVEIVTLVGGG